MGLLDIFKNRNTQSIELRDAVFQAAYEKDFKALNTLCEKNEWMI